MAKTVLPMQIPDQELDPTCYDEDQSFRELQIRPGSDKYINIYIHFKTVLVIGEKRIRRVVCISPPGVNEAMILGEQNLDSTGVSPGSWVMGNNLSSPGPGGLTEFVLPHFLPEE